MFQLGQIAYGRGDAQLAASLFTKSLERRPSFADAHIALAKILSDQKRDPEAKEQLEAALKIAPSNRTAHYRLAQLYNSRVMLREQLRNLRLLVTWLRLTDTKK